LKKSEQLNKSILKKMIAKLAKGGKVKKKEKKKREKSSSRNRGFFKKYFHSYQYAIAAPIKCHH
jgi:hypothetical protein